MNVLESRAEKAIELHNKGYNCAQAVACAYCDKFDADEDTVYKLAEGFGLGMGLMDVCGALSGAFILMGLKNSAGMEHPGETKAKIYQLNRKITEEFQEKNTTHLCRELKGTADGKVKRSCSGCIQDACQIIEKFL